VSVFYIDTINLYISVGRHITQAHLHLVNTVCVQLMHKYVTQSPVHRYKYSIFGISNVPSPIKLSPA